MILLSVVLHSAIALLPLKKAPELPQQAVLESPSAITVTRLPEVSSTADSTNSQPLPPQPIAHQPAASRPVVPEPVAPVLPDSAPQPVEARPSSDILIENVSVESTSVEDALSNEGVVTEDEKSAQSRPSFNEAEVAAMAAVWEGFLVGLQSGLSEFSLLEILNFFGQPGQEDLFFDANQQHKTSVVSHHLLEDKTPEQVFEEVVNPGLSDQEGFAIQAYGEFAGGPVYEVVQGEIVHYLNIVPLNDRSGSVLVVGDRPPDV